MPDDANTAYLLQCGESDLFAVSRDPSGANISAAECRQTWRLRETFLLGVHEPVPFAMDPEPLIRALAADGFLLVRPGQAGRPHATSQ